MPLYKVSCRSINIRVLDHYSSLILLQNNLKLGIYNSVTKKWVQATYRIIPISSFVVWVNLMKLQSEMYLLGYINSRCWTKIIDSFYKIAKAYGQYSVESCVYRPQLILNVLKKRKSKATEGNCVIAERNNGVQNRLNLLTDLKKNESLLSLGDTVCHCSFNFPWGIIHTTFML